MSALEDSLRSRQRLIVGIGAALYALSFFLAATSDVHPLQITQTRDPVTADGSNPSLPGWMCAVYALFIPFWILGNGAQGQSASPPQIALIALLVTGLINPLFLATFVNVLRHRQRAVEILRIVLVVMLLCCGIVFYTFGMYPREGFLVWVLGMLLVMSSAELAAVVRYRAAEGVVR